MRTRLLILMTAIAAAQANAQPLYTASLISEETTGFISVNFEYLQAKSASAEFFKGKMARNFTDALCSQFTSMRPAWQAMRFDPLLDMASDAKSLHVIFLRRDPGSFRKDVCIVYRGRFDKAAFLNWARDNGPQLKFKLTAQPMEGCEGWQFTRDDSDNPETILFFEDGVIFSNKAGVEALMKFRGKNADPQLLAAFTAGQDQAATVRMKEKEYQAKPADPEQWTVFTGSAVIDGGQVKFSLEFQTDSKVVLENLVKFFRSMSGAMPSFTAAQGVNISVTGLSEKGAKLLVEFDDRKWREYASKLMTPELDPAKPVWLAQAKIIPVEGIGGVSRIVADADGETIVVGYYGNWEPPFSPGVLKVINLKSGQVEAEWKMDFDEKAKVLLYPTDFRVNKASKRFLVKTYNSLPYRDRKESKPDERQDERYYGTTELRRWDGTLVKRFPSYPNPEFSPDGQWIVISNYDGIRFYSTETGAESEKMELKDNYGEFVFSPDCRRLVAMQSRYSSKSDGSLTVLDPKAKSVIRKISVPNDKVVSVKWLSDDTLLLSVESQKLVIWNVNEDKAKRTVELPANLSALQREIHVLSPDTLLIVSGQGVLFEYHLEKGVVRQGVAPVMQNRITLIPAAGKAVAALRNVLLVWDLK